MRRLSFYDKVILGFTAVAVCAFVGVGIGISRMNGLNSRLNIVAGNISRKAQHAEEINAKLKKQRDELYSLTDEQGKKQIEVFDANYAAFLMRPTSSKKGIARTL